MQCNVKSFNQKYIIFTDGNLDQQIKNLTPHQSLVYFGQLIQGVVFLQSRRIIHRDLKPGNLLLNCRKQLAIADFGTAVELDKVGGILAKNYILRG